MRYKVRLIAQIFSQRPGIDYDETYSLVMDTVTFRSLISMVVLKNLEICLMDVVTTYLYGSLDSDIYMKIPEGLKMLEAYTLRNLYSIKLQRSLYGVITVSRSTWMTSKINRVPIDLFCTGVIGHPGYMFLN